MTLRPLPAAILLALIFVLPQPYSFAASDDDESVGVVFARDHAKIATEAKKSGVPVMVTVIPRKGETFEPLADYRIHSRLSWFTALPVQPTTKLAKALSSSEPTAVAFLNGEGEVVARISPKESAEDFLKKVKKLADKSRTDFLAQINSGDTTAAEKKKATEGLIRMGGKAAQLVPLLIHESSEVKTTVSQALPKLPADEVALAALDGLASENAEMRAASYHWASTTTKVSKVPPVKFWREEEENARKEALAKWREAALVDMGPLNRDILEFCETNLGKKVGEGECAHLADNALKEVNAKPIQFSGKTYIWGREVKTGEKVLPGDVVQLEDCKFKGGGGASHHTQVIRKVVGPNKYEVLEQNVNGRRTVGPGTLDLAALVEGTVKIYRPQPK